MKNRGPITIILLTIITFGIYSIIWFVKTKNEMVGKGAKIPTAWLLIVPIANIYWLFKWAEGVELVTNKELTATPSFLLVFFLGILGGAFVQSKFNKVS